MSEKVNTAKQYSHEASDKIGGNDIKSFALY